MTKLYTEFNSSACMMTKRLLQDLNVSFTEINVDRQPEAKKDLIAFSKERLPILIHDDTVIVGFQPHRIKSLFNHHS